MQDNSIELEIKTLEEKIEKYNRAYYDDNLSLISDYEYDLLKKKLENLREKNRNNLNNQKKIFNLFGAEEVPVEQKIGYRSNSKFPKITHKKKMMSLANALTLDEFYDFIEKTNRFLKTENFPESVCELKIDGLSFSAMYNKGKLKYVATRGDGLVGEDVTKNVLQIEDFPQELKKIPNLNIQPCDLEEFEVRGEIYMSKDNFNKLNDTLDDDKKFSNPRNAASGTLRQLDSEIVKKRNLQYYTYFIGECSQKITSSQSESLELLTNLGFIVNKYWKIAKNVDEIINFHEEISKIRYNLDCDIDGVVVKINDFKIQELLGNTAHDPRWAIAFKFSGITAITKLVGITNQVGRTGIITPVAELLPVNIGGVIVKRATLHNYDEITRLGLKIGDLVSVKRSGDVIPKIIEVSQHNDDNINIIPPQLCPCCGATLQKKDDFVAIFCPNRKNCKSQIVDSIRHFASRNGLDIGGLGRQTINIFYDLHILTSILDIFDLYKYKEKLEKLDGFGEQSTKNLLTSIEESKNVYFNKVIYAIGINEIGENVAKILAKYYHNFDDLLEDKKEFLKIQNINGFGEKIVNELKTYFNTQENLEFIEKLKNVLHIQPVNDDLNHINSNGESIVFTGTLITMTRQQAKIQAENLGYKVLTEISKNTTYLVYGEKAGSKLKKAKELNINILNEQEWIAKINEK